MACKEIGKDIMEQIKWMVAKGIDDGCIAKELGMHPSTVSYYSERVIVKQKEEKKTAIKQQKKKKEITTRQLNKYLQDGLTVSEITKRTGLSSQSIKEAARFMGALGTETE